AISLDGTRETHNYIRRVPRSFDRVLEGFRVLREMGVYTAAVTSVSKRNLSELPEIYEILSVAGVKSWQIQLIIGEGRMRSNEDMPQPADLEGIARFMVAKRRTCSMNIYPGDNIGFFTSLERELRNSPWRGCFAGILSIGIEANGNIKGCLSQCPEFMENNPFVEGNIRKKSLREIWENPDGFSYNRKFHLGKVKGFCRTCKHVKECRCGCTATAYAIHGTKYENSYCIYQCVYNRNRGVPVPTYTPR
ncbi:MAG: SPASM domain-containing protein, partial [Armatimonadetes bacterium]|nr:SPASM domain-containing protein [Armatimonadota bacterium]